MRSALLLACLTSSLALSVLACSGDADKGAETPAPPPGATTTPPAAPEAPKAGALVPTSCRFAVPKSIEGQGFRCADLVVPENRDKDGSRPIKVHVIVFKGREGGVPTVELNGGPGGSAEVLAEMMSVRAPETAREYARFLELGDLVLFDQRGTGRSEPRLSCDPRSRDMVAECVGRFEGQGVDLTGYVTRESADDVHDLKVALGAPKVNLHGISYGTRLALEIVRRHSADVGSTVIDGVVHAQAKLLGDGTPNIDALLTHVFTSCAADTKCAAAYPNLDATFASLRTKLDETPFDSKIYGPYDWYAFTSDLVNRLYGDGEAGRVPFLLHDLVKKSQADFAKDEDAELAEEDRAWAEMQASIRSTPLGAEIAARIDADPDMGEVAGGMPLGMYMSVVCSDHGQYESLDDALAADAKVRPELRDPDLLRAMFDDCNRWPRRAKTADGFQPVASDRPTLVIGGEVDPATPYLWAKAAASSLAASQLVEINGGAHGAMDECAMGMKMEFLKTGTAVDASCASTKKLDFYYPPTNGFHAGSPRPSLLSRLARVKRSRIDLLPMQVISDRALRDGRNRRTRSRP